MKRILLLISIITCSLTSFSQASCPEITSAVLTPNGEIFTLTIVYSANGTKHINVTFNVGGTLTTTCTTVQGDGTLTMPSPTGVLTNVTITVGTGTCNPGQGNDCSIQILPPSGGPLPILLNSFYAKRNKDVVELNWKSSSEINAKEFILQKNNGNGWTDVKSIPARNVANGAAYSTTDINTSKGTTLYRMKMVDMDRSFDISDIRVVKGAGIVADYTVFPNPGRGNGKISITDISGPTEISIIDMSGRVIKTETLENKNSVALDNIQNGVYQIRIKPRSENVAVTRRLTVVK